MWQKQKALISCAGTAQLICVFAFAYAKCWFSHDAAQIINYFIRWIAKGGNGKQTCTMYETAVFIFIQG